ncbi:MAG: histidine phosphatase family protein, partial [Planctomycetes bacterium]|nr:histidine phosphatase family protein [Planctomycetota bacterium]
MSTRVYLVRHGATKLSAEDCFAGSTNVDLSDEGRAQASRLADRLAEDEIAAVYASPMKRTVDTATIIAKPHGLVPVTRDGLKEIDHGHWEGLRRADVEKQFANEYAAWEADPFTFAPKG